MLCIYIMDRDRRFASRLAHALGRRCPQYRFLSLSDPHELKAFEENLAQDAALLLYTVDQYPEWQPPDDLLLLRMRDKPSIQELYGDSILNALAESTVDYILDESEDASTDLYLYRLAGVNSIAEELEKSLAGHGQVDDQRLMKTVLLYTASPGQAANRIWERLLARELNKGRRVLGLPLASPHLLLAPTLLMTHPIADRADLSTLFIRLEYDEVNAKSLLPYFIPTGQGCLAMAASTGIDDINEIKPELLQNLLLLSQEALSQSDEQSTLFILTAGLSISRVRKLLKYCDEFITVSDPTAIEANAWKLVLNELLSGMNSQQKHHELWEESMHDLE